jgi:outer membrane protein assembly factor BamE (lipoprotein component of BamABCDE complex)
MKIIKKIILMILIVVLSGCGYKGIRQETETSLSQKIIEGKTAKDEIQAVFGSPASTSFDDKREVWKYESSDNIMGVDGVILVNLPDFNTLTIPDVRAVGSTKKVLTIIFDEHGVASKYSMTEDTIKY